MKPLVWEDGVVRLLDQTRLPGAVEWVEVRTPEQMVEAIRAMTIRGAPNLGIAAAFGLVLATWRDLPAPEFRAAGERLLGSRPTAVNLRRAIERMMKAYDAANGNPGGARLALLDEAQAIAREEEENCERIGAHGAALIPAGARILTLCNTGMLAAYGVGTAYGVIKTAHEAGKRPFVWACETRPRQQGLRLTSWELQRDGIPFQVIADGAAGAILAAARVDAVITGADRIAANGDTANKIGTYSLAVLAKNHEIPFYVAAPTSTLDARLPTGKEIPIEERDADEIVAEVSPAIPAYNPAFDVTPGGLITAIITERGVHRPPYSF